MLKYSVRIGEEDIRETSIDTWDMYVSPDLSFCSATTYTHYNIGSGDKVKVVSPTSNGGNLASCNVENVFEEGIFLIKGLRVDTTDDIVVPDGSSERQEFKSVYINSRYYHASGDTFTMGGFPVFNAEDKTVNLTTVTASTAFTVDYPVYVYDGKFTFSGDTYEIYDEELGLVRKGDDGIPDKFENLVKCSKGIYYPYDERKAVRRLKIGLFEPYMDVRVSGIEMNNYAGIVTYQKSTSQLFKRYSGSYYVWSCSFPRYIIDGYNEYDDSMPSSMLKDLYFDIYRTDESGETLISGETYYSIPDIGELGSTESPLYVTINGDRYEPSFGLLSSDSDGYTVLRLSEPYRFIAGDVIDAYGQSGAIVTIDLVKDDGYDYYTGIINGERYVEQKGLVDYVKFSTAATDEHIITYIDGGTRCIVDADGEDIEMEVTGNSAVCYTYIASGQDYVRQAYEIHKRSCLVIDGIRYPFIYDEETGGYYIEFTGQTHYRLRVDRYLGPRALLCMPVTYGLTSGESRDESFRIARSLLSSPGGFSFRLWNHVFGMEPVTQRAGFLDYTSMRPFPNSSDGYVDVIGRLSVTKNNSYITVSVPVSNSAGENILISDILDKRMTGEESERDINRIVEMERDIYVPKYISDISNYNGKDTDLEEINEIKFNLHFRTRNMENWKVNEPYKVPEEESGYCGWFCTDWWPYKQDGNLNHDMHASSDLIGLLGFTNLDVYYRKSRISRSFLRVSCYDSTDPNSQSLLCTSTLRLDGDTMMKKYISNMRNGSFIYVDDTVSTKSGTSISVVTEKLEDGEVAIDPDKRIDCGITVRSMNDADKSSEGFYLYIFREYSDGLHLKPMYLKVDFNHAGVGQTIPFLVPMRWSSSESGDFTPVRRVNPWDDNDDLDYLYSGYPLNFINLQLYIPIYGVYDFKEKEFAYLFDPKYVEYDSDTGTVTVNLFELKVGENSEIESMMSSNPTDGGRHNIRPRA